MNHVGKKIISDNFNDMFVDAVNAITSYGVWTEPRGFRCKELIAPQLILTNPKRCLITLKTRKLNYAYLTIEKLMYLSEMQDPEVLIAYNKKMKNYINEETGKFDGAYGDRIRKDNQFEWCFEELKKDPESRRAVVTIHDSTDCNHETKDAACTLSLQFLIRDGKLDLITTMRSNDVLWGLCLDVPAFCFLQEVMASWLEIPVGKYIHNPASLHYYDTAEVQLLTITHGDLYDFNDEGSKMPKWTVPHEYTTDALQEFWKEERRIRETGDFNMTRYVSINHYLAQLKEYWDKKKENYGPENTPAEVPTTEAK